jgi:PAS domain S-box-containing protein
MVICSYPLEKYEAHEVIDIVSNHEFTFVKRDRGWELIESFERKKAEEMLQRQRDTLTTHTRILSAILRTRDLDKLLNTILEEVMFFFQVGFGSIHLMQDNELVLRFWKGFSDKSRSHLLSFPADSPPEWIKRPLIVKELLSEQGIIPAFAKSEGIQSWICIPLELPPQREGERNKWIGTLILCSRDINALDKERVETLEAISHKIALAIDRAQSYRDAQERLFRLQALRDIDKAIIKQIDLKEVIHIVLDRVPKELGADAAAVSFLDEKQQRTKIFAMRLPNGRIIEEEVFTLAESLLHWFVDKQEPVIIYNLLQDPRVQMNHNHLRNVGIVSYLGVPLIVHNKTTGILHVLTTQPRVFRDEDVEFFRTLAGQTAIALENARVSEDLRESEKKYRIIFETTGTATTMVEEDTTISLANREFERLSGYSKEEIEGKKSWKEFVVKEDLERMKEFHIQRRIEPNAAPKNYEFRFIDRQGNIKDILLNIDMIPGTKKSIASLLNITERKEAEVSLRESEEKYRSLFEDSKDVVYISTIEGKFLDINSAGVELFGYSSKEEFLKVDIAKDLYLNPYDRKKFIQTVQQQGFVKDYELLLKRRDGEILTLLSTAIPYRDKEGNITGYRGIMRDVTQQRKLESQLLQSQKMEAVGQLAGGVAHDFNNILQAILGYASVLQMKMKEDDPLRHNADQIIVSTEKAANLIHGLLAFSRKQLISLKPVNLNEIIKKMGKLLGRVIGEDIEFQTMLADEELTVMADSGQIEQVLMNLAVNARDAMPEGGSLTIKTGLVALDNGFIKTHGYGKPGMYAVFSVTDTGIGIDDGVREKIFEPFFTTKEIGKGTGLGLSMAYGIIKQHEGYIRVI